MVDATDRKLQNPPIVEAIFDVDCDLPPGFEVASMEQKARNCFEGEYPKFAIQFRQSFQVDTKDGPPKVSSQSAIQALQFLHDDEKQVVQVRANGFSFNRLKPYSSLDEYLPEIKRTWDLYVELVAPVQIRAIRLRYINRIFLPSKEGTIDLDYFLKIAPHFPDESNSMARSGLLSQQTAVEKETGHQIIQVLAIQPPEADYLPIILDIAVAKPSSIDPANWRDIEAAIQSLRSLKNSVFFSALTKECIQLFQ